jgi:hypothetical protein
MKLHQLGIWAAFAMLVSLLSCTKNDYSLGTLPNASQLQFEVVQDKAVDPGGNTVILINKTPETIPTWDYGTGTSNRQRDTIRFAFKGEYTIKYSAITAGGIVAAEPVKIQVTTDNLDYVNDPLWTLLSGGPGNEKTWLLDANAAGNKKYFTSPIYFAGQDNAFGSLSDDKQSVIWKQECSDPNGPNCWTYAPNYTSDTWAAEQRDYGSMTFSLKGGPFLTTDHKGVAGVGTESGTFFLDVNTLTLTTSNATPLHVSYTPNDVVGLFSWRILSLTENTMQLAVKNKSKAEYQVLNFISKQYADAWTPPPPPPAKPDEGYNPTLAPGELLTMLTGGANSGRFWALDYNGNPVDWIAKGNGWTANKGSSSDWGWNASWGAVAANSWIRFENIGGLKYFRSQNGVITTGTFTIDEAKNEITLVNNTLIQNPGHWMSPANNVIKVVKAFPADYRSKGIWFGTNYDAAKDEWLAFHYMIP